MRPDARAWFRHRTTSATSLAEVDPVALLRAKRRGGHRISVVPPARNEEATVGRLVTDLAEHWVRRTPLVDEILVVDSDSTDATAEVARAAGVRPLAALPARQDQGCVPRLVVPEAGVLAPVHEDAQEAVGIFLRTLNREFLKQHLFRQTALRTMPEHLSNAFH